MLILDCFSKLYQTGAVFWVGRRPWYGMFLYSTNVLVMFFGINVVENPYYMSITHPLSF